MIDGAGLTAISLGLSAPIGAQLGGALPCVWPMTVRSSGDVDTLGFFLKHATPFDNRTSIRFQLWQVREPQGYNSSHLTSHEEAMRVLDVLVESGFAHSDAKIAENAVDQVGNALNLTPNLFARRHIVALRDLCANRGESSLIQFAAMLLANAARLLGHLFEEEDINVFGRCQDSGRERFKRARDPIAETLGLLMRQDRFKPFLDEAWSHLGPRRIGFHFRGVTDSNIQTFIDNYMGKRPALAVTRLSVDGVPFVETRISVQDFLNDHDVTGTPEILGRSHVYELSDGWLFVLKYMTDEEKRYGSKGFAREIQWLSVVRQLGLPLKSLLPEPVRTPSDCLQILDLGSDGMALPFIAPKGYYKYLDDPGIADDEFYDGLQRGVHDAFLLARHDVFQTVPARFYHDINFSGLGRQVNEDQGIFALAPQILFGLNSMGSMHDWPEAIKHGNIGVTGLRDFGDLATHEEVVREKSRWRPEFWRSGFSDEGPRHRFEDNPNAGPLTEAMLLGNLMHAAALWIGGRMMIRAGDRRNNVWKDDAWLGEYAEKLLNLSAMAYHARRDVPLDEAVRVMGKRCDYLRLAAQLAFYMSDAYADFVRETDDPGRFPAKRVYGNGMRVFGMGPYRCSDWPHVSGNSRRRLGPVNGPYVVTEVEKYAWAVSL